MKSFWKLILVIIFFLVIWKPVFSASWSGSASLDYQYFLDPGSLAGQKRDYFAEILEFKYSDLGNNGHKSFSFIPFLRVDQYNTNRTHADIRELVWIWSLDNFEVMAGIERIYWGVAESQHLVDIINQSDYLENASGLEKLGQPIINLAWVQNWGILDFYLLPYFRERVFPNGSSRFQLAFPVGAAVYASPDKEWNKDWAVRWSNHIEDIDIGLSYFSGTNRNPSLILGQDSKGNTIFVPYYKMLSQLGLDFQLTIDSWLWKLELVARDTRDQSYYAFTAGFERNFYSVFSTRSDIALMLEYLYDNREWSAETPFEKDVFVGVRWVLNDVNNTSLLLGAICDAQTSARVFNFQASQLVSNGWSVTASGGAYIAIPINDLLYGYRNDNFLGLKLSRFF